VVQEKTLKIKIALTSAIFIIKKKQKIGRWGEPKMIYFLKKLTNSYAGDER
jgi:murein endopeptidase